MGCIPTLGMVSLLVAGNLAFFIAQANKKDIAVGAFNNNGEQP
jgi:hypothetical protein